MLSYRSIDRLGNAGEDATLAFIVDNVAPETKIEIINTRFADESGSIFVTENTLFNLSGADDLSGISNTEYRIDGGEWLVYAPFAIAAEGAHRIDYRSIDYLGNLEPVKSLLVTVDNLPPESVVEIGEPQYQNGDLLYVSGSSPITLTAEDALVGVAYTEYRIDSGVWNTYSESISLAGPG